MQPRKQEDSGAGDLFPGPAGAIPWSGSIYNR